MTQPTPREPITDRIAAQIGPTTARDAVEALRQLATTDEDGEAHVVLIWRPDGSEAVLWLEQTGAFPREYQLLEPREEAP